MIFILWICTLNSNRLRIPGWCCSALCDRLNPAR